MAPPRKRTVKEISEACSAEYMKLRPPSVRRPPSKLESPVHKTKAPPAKRPNQLPPKAPPPIFPTPTSSTSPSPTAAGASPSPVSSPPPFIPPSKGPPRPLPAAPISQTLNLRKSPRLNAFATKQNPMKKASKITPTMRPLFHAPAPPPIRALSSKSRSATVGDKADAYARFSDDPAPAHIEEAENVTYDDASFTLNEIPPSPIYPVQNTSVDNSEEHSEDASQTSNENGIIRRSIRELSANLEGDEEKRGKRGVVNGTRVAMKFNSTNKQKIKLTFNKYGDIPDSRADNSLCVHAIGSVVRDEVPMVAATYGQLPIDAYRIVINRLSVHFEIDLSDMKLWNYITSKAIARFKDWKYECKQHYLKYGAEPAPKEFADREDQWKWLCEHFETSLYKKKCGQMKDARKQKIDHHSGKMTFAHRSEDHEEKGEVAPFVSTFEDVYGVEPAGAALVEKMKGKLAEVVGDQPSSGVDEPLPIDVQFNIIEDAVGQKRGRYISGVGKCMKKPARPKGGYKLSAEVQAELLAKADDRAKVIELEERVKMLETMLRGGNAVVASNASDGATSVVP